MKVIVFGATGMVGQSIVLECLDDKDVETVLAVGRSKTGVLHPKLKDYIHKDFLNFSSAERDFAGYDACFYCLGVTSAGMSEADYTRVTHDFTVAAARTLAKVSPDMTFVLISAMGADSTESGRTMWARVKGKTENAIKNSTFKRKFAIRPAFIQPLRGVKSRTKLYSIAYTFTAPLFPVLKALAPGFVTTSEALAKAMLKLAKSGGPKFLLDSSDVNALAA